MILYLLIYLIGAAITASAIFVIDDGDIEVLPGAVACAAVWPLFLVIGLGVIVVFTVGAILVAPGWLLLKLMEGLRK